MNELRIAWLLPTAWFYWQPLMSEFTKLFPNTKVFTALFPGFAEGLKQKINLEVVGQQKKIEFRKESTSYSSHITYLSPKIVVKLLQFSPQVIFTSSFGVWTILALLFKPLTRWKVVIAYEGSSPSVDYRNSPLRLLLRRIMVAMSDACISNSQAGREYLIKYLNANPNTTFARPYEVPDINCWSKSLSAEVPLLDSYTKPIFIFVGKITLRKGLDVLLKACALLRKKQIHNYTVLIIGEGEQQAKLESFCQEQEISDRVKWLGKVDYEQLGSYFQQTNVFVLPTLEDTWGMVVLEAMLCGKPILCSTAAGASELVIPGKNGNVFQPNNIESLADYMSAFIDNSNLSKAMGEKSKKEIARHTPEKAADFLSKIVALVAQ